MCPQGGLLARRTLVRVRQRSHLSVRVPAPLREELIAAATAEQRSLSSLVLALLDRGVVERARERQIVREMVGDLDSKVEPS